MTLRWFDGFETNRTKSALKTAYANVPDIQNSVGWNGPNSRVGGYHMVVSFQTVAHSFTLDALEHSINPNARDTIILGFAFRCNISDFHKNKTIELINVRDNATLGTDVEQFTINLVSAADGLTYKWRVEANAALVGETSSVYKNDEWYYVEFEVKVNQTTGTCKIVVDGVTVVNVTGKDTSTKGSGVWGHVKWTIPGKTSTLVPDHFRLDDFYVVSVEASGNNNTFMGDSIMEPVWPIADSEATPVKFNDWTLFGSGLTSRWEAVDDAKDGSFDDDATYVWTGADDQRQTFGISPLTYISQNIVAVCYNIDCRLRSAGSKNIAPLFWSTGTSLVQHSDIPVTSTVYKLKTYMLEVASGPSFDSDITAAGVEYGFMSRA